MENGKYNSLTEQLIQNGILNSKVQDDKNENIFEKYYDVELNENYSDSPFLQNNNIEIEASPETKRRINEYDLDLLKGKDTRTFKFKNKKRSLSDFLLFKFFPKLYRAKLIKKAMKKMFDLNIDTKNLFNKTIPYGENEIRYNELIKYLSYANELQHELKEND